MNKATLYDTLKAAGCRLDSHESDLYVEATALASTILRSFPAEQKTARTFTSQIDGKLWYDVPFAYTPWWERRAAL